MATPETTDPPSALPRGTRLAEFELLRVLGIGGFGIVYLAMDHALEREVAIKEYMPSSLVGRTASMAVSLLSQANAESFSLGLRSFVNEARLLARFDHPSLVKVHRYWEANNTAYMAMPYYTGSNLHAARRRMAAPPGEAWLRDLLMPLLGALERLHGEGVYHRDISPDNVILQPDGTPVLLDFGAARRVLGDKSMALTAILKPAYAPIEQYAEAGAVKQGAWTDLYSLGATLHFLLKGKAPAPATTRTVVDEMPPLASQAEVLPGCSPAFLAMVDWMLQPRPADRPQSVAALRQRLDQLPPAPPAPAPVVAPPPPPADWPATQLMSAPGAGTFAPTLVDPSAMPPATLRVPPPVDLQATQLLPPRTAYEPTALMPREHEATELLPRAPQVQPPPVPTVLASAPATVAAPPTLSDPVRVEPVLQAERVAPPPVPTTRRWPLAVGAAGVAAVALWFGLRPGAGPTPPAMAEAPLPAASASLVPNPGSASGTVGGARPLVVSDMPAAQVPDLPASASAGLVATPGLVAEDKAVPKAPGAKAAKATGAEAASAARANAAPAPSARAAAASAARAAATSPPAARVAVPPAPEPVVAQPATGGAPGLATSITRLPAADAALAAVRPTPGAEAARPVADAPREPSRAAVVSVPPPANHAAAPPPGGAAARNAPQPVVRPAERDGEPVLLQTRSLSPSERCEGRVLMALSACIARICAAEPGLRNHADCVRLRREADQRPDGSR